MLPRFHSTRSRQLSAAAIIAIALVSVPLLTAAPPPKLASEAAFNKALTQPLTARFDDMELGGLLATLGAERQLAFLLDRRIDPGQHVSWRTNGEPFLEVLSDRLSANGATARSIGSTIFVGPEHSLKHLRTIIALRMEELRAQGDAALKQRFAVLRDASPEWPEATPPRELVADLASRWNITIQGQELVPYDLWPAGLLHDVNFVEALSVVLIQFNLTFQWNDGFTAVTIVPLPEDVFVERMHKVPAARRQSLLDDLEGVLKSIDHTLERDRLTVRASIEDQEQVASLLSGRPAAPRVKVAAAPLKNRLFTLTANQVRVRDALRALQDQGIQIVYDEAAFQAAKIDLDHRVDLKLNKASAEVFLSVLCEPLGLDYTIEGITVTLKIKAP